MTGAYIGGTTDFASATLDEATLQYTALSTTEKYEVKATPE